MGYQSSSTLKGKTGNKSAANSKTSTDILTENINFLKHPALMLANLKPDLINNFILIEGISHHNYSVIEIIVTDYEMTAS